MFLHPRHQRMLDEEVERRNHTYQKEGVLVSSTTACDRCTIQISDRMAYYRMTSAGTEITCRTCYLKRRDQEDWKRAKVAAQAIVIFLMMSFTLFAWLY